MAVGRLIDNGWASMMALYGYARKRYTIMSPYITKDNSAAEDTVFAPGSFCPLEKNKWICAFLPTTNCSFPRAFTDCEPETKDVNKCLEKVFFSLFFPPHTYKKQLFSCYGYRHLVLLYLKVLFFSIMPQLAENLLQRKVFYFLICISIFFVKTYYLMTRTRIR